MFKKQNDELDDFKKKREQYSISIRRNNRQELLNKRRNIVEPTQSMDPNEVQDNIVDKRFADEIKNLQSDFYTEDKLDQYYEMLGSSDLMLRHKGIIALRILLDSDNETLINTFIQKGYQGRVMDYLGQNQYPQLKLEAIWVLANMTYITQSCDALVKSNLVPISFKLLEENESAIVDHALIVMGNISADNTSYRDLILSMGGLSAYIKVFNSVKKQTTFQNTIWAITNLCRGVPLPNLDEMETAIPVLCRALKNKIFDQIDKKKGLVKLASDILWAISNFSQNLKPRIDRIIQEDILKHFFMYSTHKNSQIYFPALRVIGNVACLGEYHTSLLIQAGIFDLAMKTLNHTKKPMRREMCWILSNIAVAVNSQVKVFLTRKDVLDKLNQMFLQEDDDIKQEICWIFANLGFLGDKGQIIQIYLHYDILKTFTELLDSDNAQLLENILKTLLKILMIGHKARINGNNLMLQKFLSYNGVEKLESLQKNPSSKVYKAALAILTKFFQLEDEDK